MSHSELDSDLYGDLYAADEFGVAEVKVEAEREPQQPQSPSAVSDTAVKPESLSPQLAPVPATAPALTPISSWDEPSSSAPVPPHVQPSPAPQTQQIPTYQDTAETDAREAPHDYQGLSVQERSVRPSEMKDEGCVQHSLPC
ncbi:hypothetical protein FA95DRAFT_1252434 [Auriscalpium vulgare]|uniref:Uncharacterized protein n=1 Tax=Auriscalpium vulgare TaxID=40419 RepID=A0ACB8S8E4_9AGAM|nr:hypothetical protein FA95DRAFT_1252434 [Auriscalpium vulgare]